MEFIKCAYIHTIHTIQNTTRGRHSAYCPSLGFTLQESLFYTIDSFNFEYIWFKTIQNTTHFDTNWFNIKSFIVYLNNVVRNVFQKYLRGQKIQFFFHANKV